MIEIVMSAFGEREGLLKSSCSAAPNTSLNIVGNPAAKNLVKNRSLKRQI